MCPVTRLICIYCKTDDQTRFKGVEHVVPQSFGAFGSETPTLQCVCDDCNSYFGNGMDRNLARQTIEGLSRYANGTFSRGGQHQSKVKTVLAHTPGNGIYAGANVTIDPRIGKLDMPAQFLIRNLVTGKNEAYALEEIDGLELPEDRYGAPGRDGKKGTWDCKILGFPEDAREQIAVALNRNGIAFTSGTPVPPPSAGTSGADGMPAGDVEMTGEVDDLHKRAIAKILVNFAAKYLGCDEVLTPRWDCVRKYVRYGTGAMRARMSQRPFWTGHETETRRLVEDSFNMRLENIQGHVVGVLQFYGLDSYELILIENDALLPAQEVAYRYTPGQKPLRGEKRPIEALSSSV